MTGQRSAVLPDLETLPTPNQTQTLVDGLIIDIKNAETAGAVTSEMVGQVFEYLNEQAKTTAAKTREIDDEKSARAAGDATIQSNVEAIREQLLALIQTTQADAASAVETANAANIKATTNADTLAQLSGKNLSDAIESLNEVLAFLDGIKDSETLAAKMTAITNAVAEIKATATDVAGRMDDTEAQGLEIVSKFGTLKETTERVLADMTLKLDSKASATAVADLGTAVAGKADAASVDGALRRVQALETATADLPLLFQRVDALEGVEPPAKFEELTSMAEYEARKAAGTLESDKLYFVPEAT